MDIRFLGHACFELTEGETRVLIDPFLTGNPKAAAAAGLVIGLGGKTVYHLGDTGLFSDLALPGKRDPIDVALVCIGGHYTMDRHDAVTAADLVGARQVIPCHYDTFPAIETDADAFKSEVSASEVVILQPGDTHSA